jgi:dCMP deaminase
MNEKILIAFVPVLHAGYLEFFRNNVCSSLYLIDKSLYGEFEQLTREIRALSPSDMSLAISPFRIFKDVFIADLKILELINSDSKWEICMPDEDICHHIADKYLFNHTVRFESVFLRYDMPKTFQLHPVDDDRIVEVTEMDRELIDMAYSVVNRSPDWWRQVGAVLVKDGQILDVAYNKHLPSEHTCYAFGDPRNNFVPGEHLDISCAHHAERAMISRNSARGGVSTEGASIYVTTFPCQPCAFDIVAAKIGKVYYAEGYSSLQSQEIFKLEGIEIIRVV